MIQSCTGTLTGSKNERSTVILSASTEKYMYIKGQFIRAGNMTGRNPCIAWEHIFCFTHAQSFQLCPLFATLWPVAYQAPLFTGISRQGCWSRLPCPPSGDLPYPESEPTSPASSALQADSLPTESPAKPSILHTVNSCWLATLYQA